MKHIGPISGIATHGEAYIATSGYDNQVILWDAARKVALGRVFHDHLANQCSFSPSGELLVSASSDYSARVWSVPDLKLIAVLNGHHDDVEMAVFSPDGASIATCSRDRTVGVYSNNGRLLHRLEGHEADVISVAWSSDGSQLLSSSDDGTIRRWDVESGEQVDLIDQDGVETDTVIITADGTIYSGDDEGRISIFRDGATVSIDAHDAGIKRLIYSPALDALASLSYDRTLCIWKIADGGLGLKQSTTFPDIIWPRSGAFLNDREMVFGTFGSSYAVYDMATETWSTDGIQPDLSVNAVALCEDDRRAWIGDAGRCHFSDGETVELGSLCNFLLPVGKMVISAGQTGEIFDARTGEVLHQHRSPINCGTVVRRDGDIFAVLGAYTGEGVVLRLGADGRSAHHMLGDIQLHANAVKGIACDGRHVFSVSADGGAAWHRVEDFEPEVIFEDAHSMIANGCAKVRASIFASVSRDLKLRLWTEPGRCDVIDTPHRNSIKCVASSPDGRFIATGGYFGAVAIYDFKAGDWATVMRPSSAGISSICALPESGGFLCSAYDGEIHHVEVGRA